MSIADGTARVRRVVEGGSNGTRTKTRDAVRGLGVEDGSIDAVRDLLFGRQFQEMEARLGALEQRMLTEVGNLQSNVSKRLDLVEEHVKREVTELESRLEVEKADRRSGHANVTGSISQINTSIDKLGGEQSRLNQVVTDTSEQLAQEISRVFKEYQQDMVEQNQGLRRDLDSTRSQLKSDIDTAQSTLKSDLDGTRSYLQSTVETRVADLSSITVKQSMLAQMLIELGKGIQTGTTPILPSDREIEEEDQD